MYFTAIVVKSKGPMALYCRFFTNYADVIVAATVGVPHDAVRCVVLGGKYVTMVAGAVPPVAPDGAVPPEIGSPSGLLQVAVMINCVRSALVLAAYCIKLLVYGAVSANSLKILVLVVVRLCHPVVVARILGAFDPPMRVVPV